MFEISVLKEMKLTELQEIAKAAKTIKISGVKKDVLIGLILEHQATTSKATVSDAPVEQNEEAEKHKKTRIQPVKKSGYYQSNQTRRNSRNGCKPACCRTARNGR